MNFKDKLNVKGYVEILKIDHRTGKTETVYEDPNVITGGLGRSMAQFMSRPDCTTDSCVSGTSYVESGEDEERRVRDECTMGGISSLAVSSTVSLGNPLTESEYGGALRSVSITEGMLYSDASAAIERQAFGRIGGQGPLVSSLVSIIHLDEETANGQLLDEVGLFVDNPYLKTNAEASVPRVEVDFSLLGDENEDSDESTPNLVYEAPGQLLAAYKQFTPIQKESYFSLLIRWKINFSVEP